MIYLLSPVDGTTNDRYDIILKVLKDLDFNRQF